MCQDERAHRLEVTSTVVMGADGRKPGGNVARPKPTASPCTQPSTIQLRCCADKQDSRERKGAAGT